MSTQFVYYDAPCRQSGATEASYFERYFFKLLPWCQNRGARFNGAGKSTLLRIMAGVDKEFEGEAVPMGGIKTRLFAARA